MTAYSVALDDPATPSPPDLPTVVSTHMVGSVERHEHRLTAQRWQALTDRAASAGAPADAVLTAAFAEVLRTWSKSPDFGLAYRAPGAPPVAVPAPNGGAFADRVAGFSAGIGQALEHPVRSDLPVVVGALDSDRELNGALLDFGYREESDGDLTIRWDADGAALPPGMCQAAFNALLGLLEKLADDPDAWQRDRFDLVPETDRALVAAVNATDAPVPDVLLHEIFADRAAERPDAEAVVDGRRRLTYGELRGYAARIGRRLRDAGVRPGDLVAIVMEKGWEQYAAVYGVLTSGGAYLPIDATLPAKRQARLMERGGVRHVLTQSRLADQLSWPQDVTLHRVDQEFEDGDDSPLPAAQKPTDLAYVIFTSGSTGEPKGVAVDHRGVVNLVTDVNARFAVGPDDRAFAISGLHFDASIYDVFGVPAAGATVVLPDPFQRAQPDRWTERVKQERVTIWNSVPAIMEMMVGQAEIRDDRPLATLRLAVLSGDWIPLTLPDRLRAQTDNLRFVGSGGPTETICWSVFSPVETVDPKWSSIPYGKPISNQRYYIVDDNLRQRPVWVPGQMAVVSEIGLAHGYFADPERTAAQFVTLPELGGRAYLTGDIGRFLPDGNIEILGREDHQVKIQGYRIELGEIEATLREHPAVEAAVVVAPKSGWGTRRLHAYVVATEPVEPRQLRARLREALPSYMVPAGVEVLDELPLTGNGKVDRRSLTERAGGGKPASATPAPTRRVRVPGTALERLVCVLMGDVLGGDPVDPSGNFLRLGGDSLSGTRLAYQLRELLGIEIPLRTVFDHPVAADLAVAIANDPKHGAAAVKAAEELASLTDDPAQAAS